MNFQPVAIGTKPSPYVAVFVVCRIVLNEDGSLPSLTAAGMDITPVGNEDSESQKSRGSQTVLKLLMMSGTMGPRILVSKVITKKVRKTKLTV